MVTLILLSAAISAGLRPAVGRAIDPPPENEGLSMDYDYVQRQEGGKVSVPGYICVTRSYCSTVLFSNTGGFVKIVGCNGACSGSCTYCFQANTTTRLCVRQPDATCVMKTEDPPQPCGTKTTGTCVPGQPGGYNTDDFGCSCQFTGTPTSKPCGVPKC
ncbi:MAG: hypothetical protein K2Q09_11900 [Phycisphaerales bacterium]|nr:hypothetical protein [Phycisphaerales bacterium]